MSISIIIAPAGGGKTTWVINRSRELSMGLKESPQVVVPSRMQANIFRRRLADAGGAIGIQVNTFEEIAQNILDLAGVYQTRITEIAQTQIMGAILENCSLEYYAGIRAKPGLIQKVLELIRELKTGGIQPEIFEDAVKNTDGGPRLSELASIYTAYQDKFQAEKWTDYAGELWLAAEMLEANPDLCSPWKTILIDGFDDLSPVQLRIIQVWEKQIPDLSITLTGKEGKTRPLVHKRFNRTLELLSKTLALEIVYLNDQQLKKNSGTTLAFLESTLFSMDNGQEGTSDEMITMAAVPDREAEVRAALRWVKALIIKDKFHPGQNAVLMRNLEPYRLLIYRIAKEYGIPVRVQGGVSLSGNPAISAVFELMRVMQPGKTFLNWRKVIESWKSPYFSWDILSSAKGANFSPDVHLRDANQLSRIARWGSIIQGFQQWEETFSLLCGQNLENEDLYEESPALPDEIIAGVEVERLWDKFQSFVRICSPPPGENKLREFISWIEDLLGEEGDQTVSLGLGVIQQIRLGPPELIQRDLEAIRVLKGIFRDMTWAESELMSKPISFNRFLEDLESAVKKTSYQPESFDLEAVYCADITDARGIPFLAAAILGLAEGEFPQAIGEDPFLRDADRIVLREKFDLPLRLSTDSAEAEYFYESITRANKALLITRPRIADNGAPWQPSPYWEEMLRCLDIDPVVYTSRSLPAIEDTASVPEYLEICASNPDDQAVWVRVKNNLPDIYHQINQAQITITGRLIDFGAGHNIHNGGLASLGSSFSDRYPQDLIWSASRLETYQNCPFYFFIAYVLDLEKPDPPREGLDARQLGNIYHHILEDLYRAGGKQTDLIQLQKKLPVIAKRVFDLAPGREGFRKTAWWLHTQEEILSNINKCLVVLETLDQSFKFYEAEQRFGIRNFPEPALKVTTGKGDTFFLRGFIDRVDRNNRGGIRIIDYKTSSSYGFTNQAVREGKKLQLPLYALAAQQALELGKVEEGFYFHVRSAQPSGFKMSQFRIYGKKGPSAAVDNAVDISWDAIQAIRAGIYNPEPPENGCPDYCPAADFCWQFKAKRW